MRTATFILLSLIINITLGQTTVGDVAQNATLMIMKSISPNTGYNPTTDVLGLGVTANYINVSSCWVAQQNWFSSEESFCTRSKVYYDRYGNIQNIEITWKNNAVQNAWSSSDVIGALSALVAVTAIASSATSSSGSSSRTSTASTYSPCGYTDGTTIHYFRMPVQTNTSYSSAYVKTCNVDGKVSNESGTQYITVGDMDCDGTDAAATGTWSNQRVCEGCKIIVTQCSNWSVGSNP